MWSRGDGVVSETLAGRAVLIDAAGNEIITLNDTGSIVWEALRQPRDSSSLVETVALAYPDVERATVERDVLAFLAQLREDGLVATDATA